MTRIAIVTTTIFTPKVLSRFVEEAKKAGVEFRLYIAGDKKTPDLSGLAKELGPETKWIPAAEHDRWSLSSVLRWNCIQRRDIGFLEAWSEGPFDFYLSIDDDNSPQEGYFREFLERQKSSSHERVLGEGRWFNYFQGAKIEPALTIFPRGFPVPARTKTGWKAEQLDLAPEKIAVFQGLSLGDPDADAMTHIVAHARVREFAFRSVVAQGIWSPINSQNTFVRERFLPLFPMFDQIGRFDDIMAGFLLQHYVYENDGWIHFGAPFTTQERGERNWLRDMELEMEGHSTALTVIEHMHSVPCKGIAPEKWMRQLFVNSPSVPPFYSRHAALVAAWLTDLESARAKRAQR